MSSIFLNINDFAGKSYDECREMAIAAGYDVNGASNAQISGFQAIWTLLEDKNEIIIKDSPLAKGAPLHSVALYNNQWYDIDNGLQDDGSILHCLSSYSVDNCNIEPPYAIIATWKDAWLFTMEGKICTVLRNPEEDNKIDIFEKEESQSNAQIALDALLENYGKPEYFYQFEDVAIPELDEIVPVLKVWAGGEYLYTYGGEVFAVDGNGTQGFGEDNYDNIMNAINSISSKHYRSVPLDI